MKLRDIAKGIKFVARHPLESLVIGSTILCAGCFDTRNDLREFNGQIVNRVYFFKKEDSGPKFVAIEEYDPQRREYKIFLHNPANYSMGNITRWVRRSNNLTSLIALRASVDSMYSDIPIKDSNTPSVNYYLFDHFFHQHEFYEEYGSYKKEEY